MKLNIVQLTKSYRPTSRHLFWLSIFLVYIGVALYYFDTAIPDEQVTLIIIILGLIPILTNIIGAYEFYPKNYKVVDQLELKPDHIEIGGRNINLEDIRSIHVEVNDWYGKKDGPNWNVYGSGPRILRGINNEIEIYHDQGKEKLRFQLESKEQFEKLSDWIEEMYRNNLSIEEEYDHERSYALHHLHLAEIAEFKRRIEE